MKFTKKSHKKVHKVLRRRSHKKRRKPNKKKVVQPMEISPISKDGSPHSLDNSPAFKPTKNVNPQGGLNSSWSMTAEDINPSPLAKQRAELTLRQFNMSPEHEDSLEEPNNSFSNVASQLDGGPSPAASPAASPAGTTVESMEVNSPGGNDDTMDIGELDGPSPQNSSANTTRDRSMSVGGRRKRKRASRKKR